MIDFCRKDTKIYNQQFIHPWKPVKHKNLTRNHVNFALLWFHSPVTTPSWMNSIPQAEFRAVQTWYLTEPLYIVETQYTMNFEQFQLQNPVSSTPQARNIFWTPKFEPHLLINLQFQL